MTEKLSSSTGDGNPPPDSASPSDLPISERAVEEPGSKGGNDLFSLVGVALCETVRRRRRTDFWLGKVDTKHVPLLLFACCYVQGLLDASAFRNWGTFVGSMTGNTVILALSTGDLPKGQPWAFGLTLIAIVSFLIGCFVSTRVCTKLAPTRRLTFAGVFLVQCLLIIIAAALTTSSVMVNARDEELEKLLHDPKILIGIAPLAMQSGMTIAISRMTGYGTEMPIVVYTSTYAALCGDLDLFKWPLKANQPRNRRLIAVLCLFAGAVTSTWIEVASVGMVAVLWMAAGIKLVLTLSVAFLFPPKLEAAPQETKA